MAELLGGRARSRTTRKPKDGCSRQPKTHMPRPSVIWDFRSFWALDSSRSMPGSRGGSARRWAGALHDLGFVLEESGVVKNEHQAFQCFLKAADLGLEAAGFGLARLHEWGRGAPKHSGMTLKGYEKAAGAGDSFFQFRLGMRHLDGNGVDSAKAVKWIREAAWAESGRSGSLPRPGGSRANRSGLRRVCGPAWASRQF